MIVEVWDRMPDGQPVLRNVTKPTLTPFLPQPGVATGAAVIVVPGGRFNILSLRNEGWAVAQWLADNGIAAFVLKYRTRETPADETDLLPALMRDMSSLMSGPERDRLPPFLPATEDAQQAVRMLRADAARWQIDPARIGMIGFSAGALSTIEAALSSDASGRPDFIGYIYGPMVAREVPATAPPMFTALAMDDPLFGGEGFAITESWRKAQRPVELHVYEKGGHGFGKGAPGTTSATMLPGFLAWLQARDIIKPKLAP